jgi:cytochrome c553
MDLSRQITIWWISLFMLLVVFAPTISAGDNDKRNQQRERKHGESHYNGEKKLKLVSNATYADQCGACHFAYQAELLPAVSWKKILEGAEDHFGEAVTLDDGTKLEISNYLMSNAADKSFAKLAWKIMRCLQGLAPVRITDIPCIRKEHQEINPQTFKRPSVGSLSSCVACHRTAANGVYDDDVTIPE